MTLTASHLAILRKSHHYTKYHLAQITGLSHSNLYKIEHGERFPTPDVIRRLSLAYLLTREEQNQLLTLIKEDLIEPYAAQLYGIR